MNKTLLEAQRFALKLLDADAAADPRIQQFVIPPFTLVREVKSIVAASSVKVGAHNMHWADDGAWTGEVSPLMLKDSNSTSWSSAIPSAASSSARPTRPSASRPKPPSVTV